MKRLETGSLTLWQPTKSPTKVEIGKPVPIPDSTLKNSTREEYKRMIMNKCIPFKEDQKSKFQANFNPTNYCLQLTQTMCSMA